MNAAEGEGARGASRAGGGSSGRAARTVDWATGRTPSAETPAEGLRERKKRLMRQQLTDTATELFVERGFDAVRVAEVAAACGVSEKTVFNYFPTKESLLLDRWDTTLPALRAGLADRAMSPVEAVLRILAEELTALTSWLSAQPDPGQAIAKYQRFGTLIHTTASLRAHQRDLADQLTAAAVTVLADRAGLPSDDPEPQIAATALLGLWQVHSRSLRRHLSTPQPLAEVRAAVTADVQRAARLIESGLRTFPLS